MTDEQLRAHLGSPPGTPVVRIEYPGRSICFHGCPGAPLRLFTVDLAQPVVWTPDGKPPAVRCYVGRCKCGHIFMSKPTP